MTYTLINPELPLGGPSQAVAMNASGYFVGRESNINNNGYYEAMLWAPNGDATVLQSPEGLDAEAIAINASDESTGADTVSGSIQYAMRWSATGQGTILSDPGGDQRDAGVEINSSGGVAGWSQTSYDVDDLVYWNASGNATVIAQNMIPTDGFTITGLNNAGDICGYDNYEGFVYSSSGSLNWSGGTSEHNEVAAINRSGEFCGLDGQSAAIWSATGIETLLTNPGGGSAEAYAINAAGETCGVSGSDAVLWSPSGTATLLRTPKGALQAAAVALNARGDSVGEFTGRKSHENAAYWSPTGALTDLGLVLGPGWRDTQATGIDSAGDVAGYGTFKGLTESFLLIRSTSGTADAPHFIESPIHHILAASAVKAA